MTVAGKHCRLTVHPHLGGEMAPGYRRAAYEECIAERVEHSVGG